MHKSINSLTSPFLPAPPFSLSSLSLSLYYFPCSTYKILKKAFLFQFFLLKKKTKSLCNEKTKKRIFLFVFFFLNSIFLQEIFVFDN